MRWEARHLVHNDLQERLNSILNKRVDRKLVLGAVVNIQSRDGKFSWLEAAGDMEKDSQYLIASITKMYTAAAILKLREEGLLKLEDTISQYLPKDLLAKIHVYKGVDYSEDLTVYQLMSHTSGLPDYFDEKNSTGKSLYQELLNSQDIDWSLERIVAETKIMKPHFKPGARGKAYYSDTNYEILGKIIETVTNKKLNDVFTELIFTPLNLKSTYLYQTISGDNLPKVYYKNKTISTPQFLFASSASGGIVSNASENMVFMKAFFNGELFPKEYLPELYKWNKLDLKMAGLEYGCGLMRCKMAKVVELFYPNLELIGHAGISGSFAFYCPAKELFITGTLNQLARSNMPFPFMIKLLHGID